MIKMWLVTPEQNPEDPESYRANCTCGLVGDWYPAGSEFMASVRRHEDWHTNVAAARAKARSGT